MVDRLTALTVRDFRSIRGPISVSLDAPAVLIHGPNGTGKTSLLSAIELGLTGSVASLARFDPDHLAYLPHKLGAGTAQVTISGDGRDGKADTDGLAVKGHALLEQNEARFYTERCYLAQATLGRLLEIYEHQDNRRTDSSLTRFVKEMLGLEALDALIDGLHAAGNVTRFRTISPHFWEARESIPALDQAVKKAQDAVIWAQTELDTADNKLRALVGPGLPAEQVIDAESRRPDLETRRAGHAARLAELAAIRRDVEAAASQVAAAAQADADGIQATAEQRSAKTREKLANWLAGPGAALTPLLTNIQKIFADVPGASSDPSAAVVAALRLVKAAYDRSEQVLGNDAANSVLLEAAKVAISQGNGRLATIDRELAGAGGANRQLAEALGAISAHIEDEHCPVCGRDYAETGQSPLAAHVSAEIARLVSAAGRVEALVKDRTTTATAVAVEERRQADLESLLLADERLDELKIERAQFSEWLISLETLQNDAAVGTALIREASQTAEQLSLLSNRSASLAGLRAQLARYAVRLGELPSDSDTPLRAVLEALTQSIDTEEARLLAATKDLDEALRLLKSLADEQQRLGLAKTELAQVTATQAESTAYRVESERRIAVARDLLGRAQAVRGQQVQRIFNEELNSVWRELFIRLAPNEDFIPAFAVPEVAGRPVEAVLETLYRAGGKGGNPRGMLSAGNLNTAALTLFLALHLSVPVKVPWLIIDDPVQSMDDVHISQFAALLRTLKRKGRQVIIAVHDRQLFDYLTLELSPAYNGDRLITIEMGRDAAGYTTAPWELMSFETDKAFAA